MFIGGGLPVKDIPTTFPFDSGSRVDIDLYR
jgi:hypothetical protein